MGILGLVGLHSYIVYLEEIRLSAAWLLKKIPNLAEAAGAPCACSGLSLSVSIPALAAGSSAAGHCFDCSWRFQFVPV